jgi:hypothetical protein
MTIPCLLPARKSAGISILAAIIVLSAFCGKAAHANSITISDLNGICGSKEPASVVACRFYILGAAEAAEVTWQEVGATPLFCISNTVTSADLATSVENDVSANIVSHPEIARLSATSSVITALGKIYPCHV